MSEPNHQFSILAVPPLFRATAQGRTRKGLQESNPQDYISGVKQRVAACALMLAATLGAGAQTSDALWQKAVEIARVAKPWVPGVAVMLVDVKDDKGKLTDTAESTFRLKPDADGKPVVTVERFIQNGTDQTAKQQQAQEKRAKDSKGQSLSFSLGDNPFDPDLQGEIRVVRLDQPRQIGEKLCASYTYELKTKSATVEGSAALDPQTGAPVEVSYSPKPLPFGVQSLTTVLRFADGPDGEGYVKEVVVDGSGGFLFMKRVFHSTVTLDEYWKTQEAS